MRVTQSMLTRSNLNYISNNYERFATIQDQINSGKKITRPSQDPVVAMKGMRYRSEVVEVEQFKRNLGEAFSWMDQADAALDETTQVLHRIKELTVQASNETYTPDQRADVAKEIRELQGHLEALANTKVSNKYIFNGTDINRKPVDIKNIGKSMADLTEGTASEYVVHYQGKQFTFDSSNSSTPVTTPIENGTQEETTTTYIFKNGEEVISLKYTKNVKNTTGTEGDPVTETTFGEAVSYKKSASSSEKTLTNDDIAISKKNAIAVNQEDFDIEVMKGIKIDVNIDPQNVFSAEMFKDVSNLIKALEEPSNDATDINKFLDKIEKHFDHVTAERADLGARYNRVELIEQRLAQQKVIATKTMSDNEDIDFEKAIIDLTTQESLHRVALAAGARIIQPTLMDFLR